MADSVLLLDRGGQFYNYLSLEQRDLIADCEKLIKDAHSRPQELTDYSYIVFPIAKMYEGFLKKLLLDLNLINQEQYYSDHFRIGKALNPNLEAHLRLESVYDKLCHHFEGEVIASALWQAWKKGRNLLFHYFPGNLSRISLSEAEFTVRFVLEAATQAVEHSSVGPRVSAERPMIVPRLRPKDWYKDCPSSGQPHDSLKESSPTITSGHPLNARCESDPALGTFA